MGTQAAKTENKYTFMSVLRIHLSLGQTSYFKPLASILGGGRCLKPSPAQAISHPSTAQGGGLVRPPLAVSPLIELELRGKSERVARRETKRLIYKLKVLGQPVTSEVRSSDEIDENP